MPLNQNYCPQQRHTFLFHFHPHFLAELENATSLLSSRIANTCRTVMIRMMTTQYALLLARSKLNGGTERTADRQTHPIEASAMISTNLF
jgi:hypothetical protein